MPCGAHRRPKRAWTSGPSCADPGVSNRTGGEIVARVFITGSSDGLGLATARLLAREGHEVVGHARNEQRADDLGQAAPEVARVITGDLSRAADTRAVAEQANALGRFDAVIHNAGVGYRGPRKITTVDGHAHVLAINVLAPSLLTALMAPPARLVYLSSGMHRGGTPSVEDLDWQGRPWARRPHAASPQPLHLTARGA